MLKKLNEYIHQRIVANYSEMKDENSTVEDAAFLTFLIFIEHMLFLIFVAFSVVSFTLLFKKEITPILW